MTVQEQLAEIKPGKNYPSLVEIDEEIDGKSTSIKFLLQSYFVGMYMAVYVNSSMATQSGDHNNRSCVGQLKRDIQRALDRGAKIYIGPLQTVKEKF